MKRIQKAIFAEKNILDQYSCVVEQVPHIFLVKKEDNQELLNDIIQNHELNKNQPEEPVEELVSTPTSRHHVIHYDHRYYDHDEYSKFCDVLVHSSGWKFYSFHRHILQEHEIQQLLQRMKRSLLKNYPSIKSEIEESKVEEWVHDDHLDFNGFKLHLPPVLFGIDVMFLEFHPDPAKFPNDPRFSLAVDPSDAIYSWVVKHAKECLENQPLNIPKVPYSEKWMKNMHEDFKLNSSSNEMEATCRTTSPGIPPISLPGRERSGSFTSPNAIPVNVSTPTMSHRTKSIGHEKDKEEITLTHIQAFDWTYTTDYCFSLFLQSEDDNDGNTMRENEVYSLKNPIRVGDFPQYFDKSPKSTTARYSIKPVPSSGINYETLKNRELPILFYDEIILYEDDLEDCGEVSMEAKIRVMPTCWFLLLKFFVRIDNVIVRSRETRLYYEFPSPDNHTSHQIHMEIIWREKDLSDGLNTPHSTTTSLPTTPQAFTTAQHHGSFSSPHPHSMPPPPMMIKKYTKENIQDIPVVNQREGIHQFYTIEI